MAKTGGTAEHKCPTGVFGLDAITGGGIPRGRTTLVGGDSGTGKTVLTLQTLVTGARDHGEPGIFVAFEESVARIKLNAGAFGWNLDQVQRDSLFFLDAQPAFDLIQSGDFDFSGMLAGLDAKVEEMGARRIVFDAIDVVLSLFKDPATVRREVYRLHDWLLERELTAIITLKTPHAEGTEPSPSLNFMQFMVDCSIMLQHDLLYGVSQRNLRVIKYRGSGFDENEAPLTIGDSGVEVASIRSRDLIDVPVTTERISAGFEQLDVMLGGGYFRGASILITGAPGTAKTTLSGAFARAACERGEQTLFVSFDSRSDEVVRNLRSVGIELQPFVDRGALKLLSSRSILGNAERHLMEIKRLAAEVDARCLVVDPVSALTRSNDEGLSHNAAERLIDWAKSTGITALCTSLIDPSSGQLENTPIQISTMADTWIHLNYQVHAGERNRGLTIVKSRGTAHSTQVRELVLSESGIQFEKVFTAGGEVLMGTLRYEKERAERMQREAEAVAARRRQAVLNAELVELEMRQKIIERELATKRAEREAVEAEAEQLVRHRKGTLEEVRSMRGGEAVPEEPDSEWAAR